MRDIATAATQHRHGLCSLHCMRTTQKARNMASSHTGALICSLSVFGQTGIW